MTVNGTGFATGAVVQWNGQSLSTTFVGATQLTATVPAERIATAGSATITVVSENVTTAPVTFTITDRPTITSLNPDSRTAGSAGFTLTVNGTGFATGAVVQWNGQSLPTTFVGATQLTATVTAERIATPGSAAITVVSQNVTSPAFAFPINNRPQITSLNPDARAVGTPAFTLTVNGSGFATGAVVQWNGQPLPTTFVNSGTLSAAVTAERVANPGTANITVVSQDVTTSPVVFPISALLTIATGPALPSATAGSAYSQRLLATGGTGTFADWVILSGSLPAGLTLDPSTGILAGTPAARSFAAFTVQVSDSSGNKATKLFSIQVLAGGPPSLSIAPESISLEIAGGVPASEPKINVQVRGAGSLAVRAAPAETPWLSVTPATSTATADTPVSLTIQVNATALAQGTHFGRITVTAGGSTWIVPVTVVVRPAPKPTLQLSQGGLQFKVASGVTTVPAQQFAVINSGQGLLMWTASAEALSSGPSWLSVSPPAGTSDASSRSAPIAEVRVNPAGLAPGNYHGQIRVSAPDATNRSQVLSVALSVLPPETKGGAACFADRADLHCSYRRAVSLCPGRAIVFN